MEPDGSATEALPAPELSAVVEAVGTILYNSIHQYWFSATDAADTIAHGYDLLSRFLERQEIVFRVDGEDLIVNQLRADRYNEKIRALVRHLTALEILNFTFTRGLTKEDFQKFIALVESTPDGLRRQGGFAAALQAGGFKQIATRTMVLREITEDEVVVSKEALTQGAGGGGEAGAAVGGILAFLKGEVPLPDGATAERVRRTASDAEAMAALILQAAEIRPEAATVAGGESLGQLVVGCLRRMYDGLVKTGATATPKGGKQLARHLVLLEKEILERMRAMAGHEDAAAEAPVTQAVREMVQELEMDALASDYMKRRQALAAGERQMMAYLKEEEATPERAGWLQARLAEKGLAVAGWQELLVRGGVGAGSGGWGGGAPLPVAVSEAITHLTTLLTHMDRQFAESEEGDRKAHIARMVQTLTDVNAQVGELTAAALGRIRQLAEAVQADTDRAAASERAARAAGAGPHLSRREMLDAMAGIMRTLVEPVELIKASLEMLGSKALGRINASQAQALRVAEESAARVRALIEHLQTVAAAPGETPAAGGG